MDRKYKYLAYFLSLLYPLALLAFYKPYFQFFPHFDGIKNTVHFHTIVASIWIAFLIIQPVLIGRKKYDAHRLVGKISYVWFPILVASFIPLMVDVFNSEFPKAVFFSSADLVLLILFYSLAIYHRKRTPLHMRYMILTAMVFLGPTVGRIGGMWLNLPILISQGAQYLLVALILAFLIYKDKSSQKKSRPYYVGSTGFALHALIFYIIFT